MIKFDHCHFVQGLLPVAALAMGLLAESAAPAVAGSVTVTGANGANAFQGGVPGGAGGAATATEKTTDPSNSATATATATGGAGGGGGPFYVMSCLSGHNNCTYGGRGGAGGLAIATATTAISATGAALAEATSTGGIGGRGGFGLYHGGNGGTGGNATSSATASAGSGSASATATSTGGAGGAGGGTFSSGVRGAGGTRGTASAKSDAKSSSGEALATAFAPGGAVSAVSNFAVGSGPEPPAAIMAGWVVSDAKRTPGGSVIGYGAMSAGSGESGAATALFDFSATVAEALDLNLLSDSFLGSSDTVELKVTVGGKTTAYDFSNLTFPKLLLLGTIAAGNNQAVSLSFDLTGGNGFGFTYDFADPRAPGAIPELSTWAMMLVGFAGLAFAGYRARRGAAFVNETWRDKRKWKGRPRAA